MVRSSVSKATLPKKNTWIESDMLQETQSTTAYKAHVKLVKYYLT